MRADVEDRAGPRRGGVCQAAGCRTPCRARPSPRRRAGDRRAVRQRLRTGWRRLPEHHVQHGRHRTARHRAGDRRAVQHRPCTGGQAATKLMCRSRRLPRPAGTAWVTATPNTDVTARVHTLVTGGVLDSSAIAISWNSRTGVSPPDGIPDDRGWRAVAGRRALLVLFKPVAVALPSRHQ
jgi:hypothetical protein